MSRTKGSKNRSEGVFPPDKGCARAKFKGYDGKCLDCPFARCFEDSVFLVGKLSKPRREQRNLEIKRLRNQGVTLTKIGEQYNMSAMSISIIVRGGC
jgi:hypothetical protein